MFLYVFDKAFFFIFIFCTAALIDQDDKFQKNDPLAQAAEHLPFKQGVPGSIPGWITNGLSVKILLL